MTDCSFLDKNVEMDHFSQKLSQFDEENDVVSSPKQAETSRSLLKSKSTSALLCSDDSAHNESSLPVSGCFSLRFFNVSNHRRIRVEQKKAKVSFVSPSSVNYNYTEDVHFLIPQRFAYAVLTRSEATALKRKCRGLNVSLISSDVHRQYLPLCADFGPVNLNIVHRFCEVERHPYVSFGCVHCMEYLCIFPRYWRNVLRRLSNQTR